MKLRAKLLLPIVIAVAVTGFASFVSLRTMLNGITHQQAEQTQHLIDDGVAQAMGQQSRVFSSVVDQMALTAQKQAAMLCADPLVLEAYKIANEGDLDNESDPHVQQARQMLRQAMAPMLEGYASQTRSGKFKIHFHLTNARSLVRLWRDGWNAKRDGQKVDISDDLSSFRRTVVQINQGDHVAIRGIEIGRGGFAIRGLAAIRDASGQHLGSVEVLYPFSDVTDQLAGQTDAGLAVFMQKRNLSVAKKLNDPARFPVLGGQFVRCAINQGDVLEPMIDSDLLTEGLDEVVVRSHGEYAVGAWPIRDFAGQAVGVMVVGADTRSQAQSLAQITSDGEARSKALMMRLSVGLIVVSVVLTLIFAFVLRRVVLKPIAIMVDRLRDIAEGEGDLTRRLAEDSKDEIGDLARWFNLFVNRVHDLVYHVRTDAQEVAAASTQIAASSEQMSSGMGEQALQVQQIASAIEQMAVSVSDVAGKCQQAADESGQAGDTARAGSQVVEQAVEDMNVIRDAVGASSISVTELGKRSEQIGQVIDVINDIADQTNLLALNAAIEAARAGEHGRGFAVVADEVRKLADRTTQATGDVGETIRSIQQETAQAVSRMEHGSQQVEQGTARAGKAGEALNEIVRGVAEVTLLVQGIAAAAQEQSAAAIEISQSVESISGVVSEANESSRQSSQAASQMSCKAESLQEQIAIFKLRDSA